MSKVRILADDLTGALDAAARFVPMVSELAVSWISAPENTRGAAFDTETRDLAGPEAGAGVAAAGAWLCGADISYKKIDSQLRGPVAEEIAAAFRAGRFARAIIAPAFPDQERITRDGRQWVRDQGKPEWRRVGPDLAARLRQLGLSVKSGATPGASPKKLPPGLTLWDARTDSDLDGVVKAGMRIARRTLWCGSAGLAGALARHHVSAGKTCALKSLPGPLLFVVGTARPAMLGQLNALTTQHPDCWIRIGANPGDVLPRLRAGLAGSGFVLITFDPGEGLSETQAARIIRAGMATLLLSIPQPGSLFVSGGETLHAALNILGAREIRVDGEFEPGIPTGRLCGGHFDGTRLISKSGAFGTPDILVRIAAVSGG